MTALSILQSKLRQKKIQALLVSQPENRRYLSGYTARDASIAESSGHLLIPRKGTPLLLTDSRFKLQAETECPAFEVLLYKKGLMHLLQKLLPDLGLTNIAFESDYFLYSKALELHKICKTPGVEAIPVTGMVEKLRRQKSAAELDAIRQSVALNEKVFQKVYRTLKPGVTEAALAMQIEALMRRMGAERPSFETIVASGPNGAMPHAVPSDRVIGENEPVVIDMGLVRDGLCSDMTRTIVLGEPDEFTRKIFTIVRQAQLAAIGKLKAGAVCKEVDRAARSVISKNGYGDNFGHGLGHGVGYAVHEAPSLNPRSAKKLTVGMVVTVEPGIYIPGWGGVRLENMLVVEEDGCELLNQDTTFLEWD